MIKNNKMNKKILLLLVCLCCIPWGWISAQHAAVKTNVIYGATLTPNLSVEFGLGKKTSLEIAGGYNWFTYSDNKKMKHYLIQPEFRYWFCERFARSFIGFHVHGGEFNVGGIGPFTTIKNHRYEGYFYGAGASFGHQWALGKRWGLEAEIGVGYARLEYDKYGCHKCAPRIDTDHYNYFGVTRASVAVVFYLW